MDFFLYFYTFKGVSWPKIQSVKNSISFGWLKNLKFSKNVDYSKNEEILD